MASIKSSWVNVFVIFTCTLYLRYEEKFRKWIDAKQPLHDWIVRMAQLSKILEKVPPLDRRKPSEIEQFRSEILECIVSGVAEILDLPAKSLTANLLDIGDHDKTKMVVSARSTCVRPIPMEYAAVDAFLPWRAIKNSSMEVEDNYREREGLGKRPYKSVVAIPVIRGKHAYGSLSIDCTVPYAFSGRKLHIYCQVRPYISLLALTYPPASPYNECSFNPAHLG